MLVVLGESVWDYDAHNNPTWFPTGQNGDVACDAYHNTDVDVGKGYFTK